MSAKVRVIAEIDNDSAFTQQTIQVEARANDEFIVMMRIDGEESAFHVAAETIRNFCEALQVVLDDVEVEDDV